MGEDIYRVDESVLERRKKVQEQQLKDLRLLYNLKVAQSVRAVEYTDCTSAEG